MSHASSYNVLDRALHYLAFSTPLLQRVLSDLECDLFKRELDDVRSRHEVFVTGLPRAGTTLLLELLYGTGEFAAFTYRHMPFVLAPLIWDRIAKSHRRPSRPVERAHGDGVVVSFDSPEAFEEVVWLAYMRRQIVKRRTLAPVTADMITPELACGLRDSVAKLLALSAASSKAQARYLSKNNANLSRLDALGRLFPSSTAVVVFREPLDHVSSLQRQHERFSREHAANPFAKHYMGWLGHFEFGDTLKPINFSSWLDDHAALPPLDTHFWLKYWTVAYAHALEHADGNVVFVDFDRLLEEGAPYLGRVAEALDLADPGALTRAADRLRDPTTRPAGARPGRGALTEARRIHARLRAQAV